MQQELTLVTGGGGFLGRYIVEQLQRAGHRVRILARGDYPELAASGVDVLRGDVRDRGNVDRAVSGVETVFHVAAIPGIWGSWERFHSINVVGTENLLEAAGRAGVKRFIYTSSPSVVYDGRPHENADESLPFPDRYLCHYPRSKAIAERNVLGAHGLRGMATVALRPHLIWGPRDNHLTPRLIDRARRGKLRQVGDGTNLISMSYVENAAAAHLQAADGLSCTSAHGGKAYFINEPEPVRLWDWVNDILALAGLRPLDRRISYRAAYVAGSMLEAGYWLLRLQSEPMMTRFLAAQLSQSHYYSIAAAQRDFGYAPVVDVKTGMRRLDEWLSSSQPEA
jgi:nucleoside-diphosphate-sugar epimerase